MKAKYIFVVIFFPFESFFLGWRRRRRCCCRQHLLVVAAADDDDVVNIFWNEFKRRVKQRQGPILYRVRTLISLINVQKANVNVLWVYGYT